ncbi:fasciculation and elongation protein zeta-2 isoform X1 [Paramormyrops kingsleyae]|uniref:Fasciculation and elongation protein zeta 2a n=1 Tax=Paramormyrops kingsleyae TaxID=1676925 RepID=A0A3B3SRB3_9TELE|nr:fasciculation and elongation protein zeta-2 isoform X1 [Paramormyrops kingsleyae]
MAAPLAQFDEDWQDFNEFRPLSEPQSCLDAVNWNAGDVPGLLEDFPELEGGLSGDTGSFQSMEDLVNSFEEKLTVCFRNYNTNTENIAPVNPITEDSMLKDDEIWNALTGNYGNVMPVDWKTSHARSLHLPTLNLTEKGKSESVNLDLSDDEELREQLDMHSIIISCVTDEPLFTAEQVIEEIEEMMQESPDPEEEENPSQSDLSLLSQEGHSLQRSCTSSSYEERLKHMSVAELNELLEEVEMEIRQYSEELIQQLALRDELDFEKEVKNSFISVLIEVQNRQKEHRELLRKKRRLRGGGGHQGRAERAQAPGTRFSMEVLSTAIQNGFRHTFGSALGDKQYLTTVIPYEKKGGPPSVEDLQILTKILRAMREDSDKVPSLLTDYILKVLCPT